MLASDISFMQRCLVLAKKGQYTASPNPLVGSVIVSKGEIVGEGWHQIPGQGHGEINALAAAGGKAKGACLYVNLEPCNHQGRTGPCSEAVIAAGISKVVFGMFDPNPQVAGKGIDKLLAAGLEVAGPVLEEECRQVNPGFLKRVEQGLPYVRCKLAMSLDGRTAMANGESQWITGADARTDVQKLRARSDAIITGLGTILADDPSLTVRIEDLEYSNPVRIIVDSQLRMPVTAKTLALPGKVLLATAQTEQVNPELLNQGEVVIKTFAGENGQVDLPALLKYLAVELHCNEVLLESGPVLAGAMLEAGLIDEIITYVAPDLMGSRARPLFELSGLEHMRDKISLEFLDVKLLGKDCRMRSRVVKA